MSTVGIIPARFDSTRFPGKVLFKIKDKPLIQHVYEHATKALQHVYVATDNELVEAVVKLFGGRVLFTSDTPKTGTDRCAEAVRDLKTVHPDIHKVINIQADMPFIPPMYIRAINRELDTPGIEIATLVVKIGKDTETLLDKNCVKVVMSVNKFALYFSRQTIPNIAKSTFDWDNYYKHIGVYGYAYHTLLGIHQTRQTPLELAESLEQNRWLEHRRAVKCIEVNNDVMSIDTPEDIYKLK